MDRQDEHESYKIMHELRESSALKHKAFKRSVNLAHRAHVKYGKQYGVSHPNQNIERGNQIYERMNKKRELKKLDKALAPKEYKHYSKLNSDVKRAKGILKNTGQAPSKNLGAALKDMDGRLTSMRQDFATKRSSYKLSKRLHKASRNNPSFKKSSFGRLYNGTQRRLQKADPKYQAQMAHKKHNLAQKHLKQDKLISPKQLSQYKSVQGNIKFDQRWSRQDPTNPDIKSIVRAQQDKARSIKSELGMRRDSYHNAKRLHAEGADKVMNATDMGKIYNATQTRIHAQRVHKLLQDPNSKLSRTRRAKQQKMDHVNSIISPKHERHARGLKQNLKQLDQRQKLEPDNDDLRFIRDARAGKLKSDRIAMQTRRSEYKVGKKLHAINPQDHSSMSKVYNSVQKRTNLHKQLKDPTSTLSRNHMSKDQKIHHADSVISPKHLSHYNQLKEAVHDMNNMLKRDPNDVDMKDARDNQLGKIHTTKLDMKVRRSEYKLGKKMYAHDPEGAKHANNPFGKVYNQVRSRQGQDNSLHTQLNDLNRRNIPSISNVDRSSMSHMLSSNPAPTRGISPDVDNAVAPTPENIAGSRTRMRNNPSVAPASRNTIGARFNPSVAPSTRNSVRSPRLATNRGLTSSMQSPMMRSHRHISGHTMKLHALKNRGGFHIS